MDALPYVDTLFKEYLLFRGFVNTLETFNRDLAADPGCGFQADRITELIFRKLIPGLDCQQLVDFLEHLNGVLYSRLDSRYEPLLSAVEADILRAFLVCATTAKRPDKVAEFFRLYAPQLLSNAASKGSSTALDDCTADWRDWFILPYLPHPEKEARFQAYFSAEWLSLLEASFRNFLAGVMRCLPLPAVLRFNTDRRLRLALQQQVTALQSELDRARQQLIDVTAAFEQQQQQVQQAQQKPRQQSQQLQQDPSLQQILFGSYSGATPSIAAVDSQHKQEASLGDWQLQLHARLHRRSSTATDVDGQELQDMHHRPLQSTSKSEPYSAGSGLFELLPLGQLAAQPASAGHGLEAGSSGTHRRQSHSRAASSGGISFAPELKAGGANQTAATADDAQQDSTVESHMMAGQSNNQSAPINIASSGIDATLSVAGGLDDSGASSVAVVPHVPASSAAASGYISSTGPLSSSPVMSWASGMMAAGSSSSSSSGMRARRTISSSARTTSVTTSSAAVGSCTGRPAGVAPVPLLPGPLRCNVAVHRTHHHQQAAAAASTSGSAGVTCVAFSPSGANVASAYDGVVAIWSPPSVPGNAGRHASVVCGAPVCCVAWDTRADKLMLIGCAAAGGVRAWHADTRRVMQDVSPEPGFPVVVAVAACPSEPTFVVAANNRPITVQRATDATCDVVGNVGYTAATDSSRPAPPLVGRLTTFNGRSFKRSAVLALPDEVGCAALAYSSTGSQLIVGTTAGTALLYEPSSRSSPLRVWQVATVDALGQGAGSSRGAAGIRAEAELPVQVLWRPCRGASAGGNASTVSLLQFGSTATSATAAVSGSFFSMCAGVLCEWAVAGFSSRTPLAAVDVIAAAAATLATAHNAGHSGEACTPLEISPETPKQPQLVTSSSNCSNSTDRHLWVCQFAVSPDGCQVAALAGMPAAGVLLLYDVGGQSNDSSSSSEQAWSERPQVLLQGDMLAGGGCVCWHPALPVLIVGCAGSNTSLTVALT